MKKPLVAYARELLSAGSKVEPHPVLLWEIGDRALDSESEQIVTSAEEGPLLVPRPGNPLVLPIKIAATQPAVGSASVGRNGSNDLVIENASVSRLHALIHQDPRTHEWKILDVGSRNGTWVDGRKLAKEETARLKDGVTIKMGNVGLLFLLPESFSRYLSSRLESFK